MMKGKIYYLACSGSRRVKIGFTSGPVEKRIKALQTGASSPLALIAVHPGTPEEEQQIHAKFSKERLHGEWFEMSEDLFCHICTVVIYQAKISLSLGEELAPWVVLGIRMIDETCGFPPDFAELLATSERAVR